MGISALGPLALVIPGANSLALVIVAFCVIAVVCSAWLGSLGPIITEVFPLGNVASVWGIAGAFGAIGAIVFNYFVGHVTEAIGVDRLFIVMAVLHPLAALIIHFFLRDRKSLSVSTPVQTDLRS
jgi:ACS family hexuronate transporter-like MFS transporter